MKFFRHGYRGVAIAAAAWLCLAPDTARADTITVDETTYEDVLVLVSDTSYHIFLPDEGKAIRVLKESVDESQVTIAEDETLRQELLLRYDASVRRLAAAAASGAAADDVFRVRKNEGLSSRDYYDASAPRAPELQVLEVLKRGPVEPADATITVIEFWATWCGPCRSSIPELTRLQSRYAPKGVAFIGVTAEPPEVALPYVTKMGDEMNYTVVADYRRQTSYAYASLYNVSSIPHAYIVGPEGNVEWHGHPMAREFVDTLDALTK